MELLESPHLEVRLSAGEALALIFELGRESDDQFADDAIDDIVEILKKLAKDSNKHRAKRDKKVQRATFRDILNYIEVSTIKSFCLQMYNLTFFRTTTSQVYKSVSVRKF